MKIHVLHCGYIRVSETVPYGNRVNLRDTGRQLLIPERKRIELPVCVFLVEHPKGLLLVDTGWSREISPEGIRDQKAADRVLPRQLAALYHPWVPAGMTVSEQLLTRGIRAEDLDCVILTHLDPDHVSGLHSVGKAKRIILAEDEYFFSCRTVYKLRQPWKFWIDEQIERLYYRGSPLGPNHWAIDLFGDESVQLVNTPGHTDGHASVILRNGEQFVLLTGDAAFSEGNWKNAVSPGLGLDRRWMLRSLQWIRETAAEPGCRAVLCSHDPAVHPQLIDF